MSDRRQLATLALDAKLDDEKAVESDQTEIVERDESGDESQGDRR